MTDHFGRNTQQWAEGYQDWSRKPLDKQQWVYLWADGIHSGVRAEDAKLCALTVIGVDDVIAGVKAGLFAGIISSGPYAF